ncbi:hypothetical protein Tco_0699648 [Tanacetum coccineum]
MKEILQAPTEGVNTTSRESSSKTDERIDKLADQILTLIEIVSKKVVTPATVKVVEESCVTCSGPHAYYNCPNTDRNQSSVCAATTWHHPVLLQCKEVSSLMTLLHELNEIALSFKLMWSWSFSLFFVIESVWKKRLQETITELTLEESLSMFMDMIAKRLDENTNLLKELQASTDFALRNKKASIKSLEIQVRKMSIILHEKLSRYLQSSTVIKPRSNDETISTSVKADKPSIRRIDASQYAVSNLQNRNLFSESKKTTLPSPNHLNDDYWDKLKETDGEKDLEAHCTNTKPLGKALPRKKKDPGSFTLPCFIYNMCFNKSLAYLGASVSVMPYSTYPTLGLGDLIPTKLIVELADRRVKRPKGIVENVLVGRPFLSTTHAIINVFKAKITLSVGNDKIFFKSNKLTSNIINKVCALSFINSTKLDLEARLMGDELRKNKSQDPNFEDFIEPNDPNEPIEHRRNRVKIFIPIIKEGEGMDEPIFEDIETKFDNIRDNEDECEYLGFYNFCHS